MPNVYMRTILFCVLWGTLAIAQTPITAFYYTASPLSYVVRGQTATLTPADGYTFMPFTGVHFYGDSGPDYVDIEINGATPGHLLSLSFAVPKGKPLAPGTYLNATRYGFEDPAAPGLEFDAHSAGDNQLTGQFTILEANISNGAVVSFAADFTQYDEGAAGSWVYGSIRYHSSIPLNVLPPQPVQPLSVACTDSAGPTVQGSFYKGSARRGLVLS